jgi:hypothetical protein
LDALKGVIFADDKQVTKTIELKVWDLDASHDGQTIISFKEIDILHQRRDYLGEWATAGTALERTALCIIDIDLQMAIGGIIIMLIDLEGHVIGFDFVKG